MVSRTLAFVAVLAFATLLRVSAPHPGGGTIVYEFQQVGDDVKITVEGTLTTALPSVADSGDTAYDSVCAEPTATFASAALGAIDATFCLKDDATELAPYALTLTSIEEPFAVSDRTATGEAFAGTPTVLNVNIGEGDPNAVLYAPHQHTVFSSTATFKDQDVETWLAGATPGLVATFTIDNHGGTLEIRIAEPDSSAVVGDPHFFVGQSLYDWKQVGVYDHLVFADHAVTLEVEEFAGCDGEMSGEFILGLSVSGSSWTAACDGIYDGRTGEVVAKHRFSFTTSCVTATVSLTNGYLNLHNITTSCKVEGGVHKAMTDHAASNADGWWEWTEAGGFELKDKAVPKLRSLVKKPRVIAIDI